jgi:hypothetical protein
MWGGRARKLWFASRPFFARRLFLTFISRIRLAHNQFNFVLLSAAALGNGAAWLPSARSSLPGHPGRAGHSRSAQKCAIRRIVASRGHLRCSVRGEERKMTLIWVGVAWLFGTGTEFLSVCCRGALWRLTCSHAPLPVPLW